MASRIGRVAVVVLLTSSVGCPGSDPRDSAMSLSAPDVTTVTAGIPFPDGVEPGATRRYAVDLAPAGEYVLAITALTGPTTLVDHGADATFAATFRSCGSGSGPSPIECAGPTPGGGRRYLSVTGGDTAARYVVVAARAPVFGEPPGGDFHVTPGMITNGWVATRSGAQYWSTGLTPLTNVSISVMGVTGGAQFIAFGTPPIEWRCPGDATGWVDGHGCNRLASESGSVEFGIASGPLERNGAAYLILVWPGGGPFVVVESEPPHGDVSAHPMAPIRLVFSGVVDPASVSSDAFRMTAGGVPVPGSLSVSENNVTFTPDPPLAWGTAHTVEIASDVRDVAGDALVEPFSFQFTTRQALDFALSVEHPAASVVQGGTAGAELVFTVAAGAAEPVPLSISGCPPAAECTLSPAVALATPISTGPFLVAPSDVETVALRIVTSSSTPEGTYAVEVVAATPLVTRSARVDVTVTPRPAPGTPRLDWSSDGLGVSVAPGHQMRAHAVGDGLGGLLLAWEDGRFGHPNRVYAQRLDARGLPLWNGQGVPVAPPPELERYPPSQGFPVIAEAAGGAFVAFADWRYIGDVTLRVQRLGADGMPLWGREGIQFAEACCDARTRIVQALPDDAGGVLVVWEAVGTGPVLSLYAQRFDAAGLPRWAPGGIVVQEGTVLEQYARVVPDGADGAILIWQDFRSTGSGLARAGVFAQRIDGDGSRLWGAGGIRVTGPTAGAFDAIPDDGGGALVAWVDARNAATTDDDLFAARIDADGAVPWQEGGIPLCTRTGAQQAPSVATDGMGGAFVVWADPGASPPGSGQQWIFAQRIGGDGAVRFARDGMPVYADAASSPRVVDDRAGGALVTWSYFAGARAQRLDGSGSLLWGAAGTNVMARRATSSSAPFPIADGAGGAFVHWVDDRMSPPWPWDIYAQHLGDR